jgi:hypothetical protein
VEFGDLHLWHSELRVLISGRILEDKVSEKIKF